MKKNYRRKIKGFFIDIGIKKNLNIAKQSLPLIFNTKSIILDRDGVINKDLGYVYKFQNFLLNRGVIKSMKYLNKKNIKIFIATNQSGIARGYYTVNDFHLLHKKFKNFLFSRKIYINDVYYCPHHPLYGKGIYLRSVL